MQRDEVISVEDKKFLSISKTGNFHGLAVWFDVTFDPIIYDEEYEEPFAKVELKTGPCDPETHWKQTILVVPGNMAGKCAFMKALLEKEDKEMQDLEEI